ncbi:MAG: hypothetical protein IJ896_11825 [Fibrobacter sp.]|nr:hypothetical protein [Fibrobacter sp.]
MKHLTKIACRLAAAALTFTLAACDDSSSASVNGPDIEENSSESNGGNGSDNIESSATAESSATVNSSATAESSATEGGSSASHDDNSSSSMAITCQALTLECYSAAQLCNKGLTEYCVNSSSSGKEKCKNVSNIDGGSCQDYDTVIDCETGAYAVCLNNTWELAIIGASCPTTGKEMTVNEINLICNEGYWKYKSTIDKCPPGSSCQPPNYGCQTHPINGFSCDERNEKVYELTVTTRGAGDCMYQCSNGKYHVVMPPVPTGN